MDVSMKCQVSLLPLPPSQFLYQFVLTVAMVLSSRSSIQAAASTGTRCQSLALASPASSKQQLAHRRRCACAAQQQETSVASKVAAGLAACAVLMSSPVAPQAAFADIQTVPPSQLTELAKPLPKQKVEKGKVWAVFVGGAALLFAGTVAAENVEAWFPAISKANKAMAISREAAKKEEERARNAQQMSRK